MNKLTIDKPTFTELGHTYTSSLGTYTSVTTLIHSFEPVQDWEAIAIRYAAKHGNTPEYWKAEWAKAGEVARVDGTKEHKVREELILGSKVTYTRPNGEDLPIGANSLYTKDLFTLPDGVYPELLIWNNDYMLSGTADVVVIQTEEDGTRTVFIEDYKTNKEIKDYNYINKKDGRKVINSYLELPGIQENSVCNCDYWKYQLQLNFYGWMLSKFGFKPIGGNIIHTKANDKRYPLRDLQTTIQTIMENWKLDNYNKPTDVL